MFNKIKLKDKVDKLHGGRGSGNVKRIKRRVGFHNGKRGNTNGFELVLLSAVGKYFKAAYFFSSLISAFTKRVENFVK